MESDSLKTILYSLFGPYFDPELRIERHAGVPACYRIFLDDVGDSHWPGGIQTFYVEVYDIPRSTSIRFTGRSKLYVDLAKDFDTRDIVRWMHKNWITI